MSCKKQMAVVMYDIEIQILVVYIKSPLPPVNVVGLFSIVAGLPGCREFNYFLVCCLYQNFMGLSAMNNTRRKKKQGCIIFHWSGIIIIIITLIFVCSLVLKHMSVLYIRIFFCANTEIGCCVYHILNEHSVKIIRSCLMYPVYLFAVRKFMFACARKKL